MDPQFYAFRWVTLLLSQEFSFPDVLRIWDTVLSDPHGRMDCMMRICTAMILNVKPRLMQVGQGALWAKGCWGLGETGTAVLVGTRHGQRTGMDWGNRRADGGKGALDGLPCTGIQYRAELAGAVLWSRVWVLCPESLCGVPPAVGVAWHLQGDFTVILKTLQRYPPVDINVLLQRAAEMPPCRTILGAEV